HDYFVNMTPVAYDVYVSNAWKTMLIGGEAQGGSGLFALDVTSPSADSVKLMWDVNYASLNGSWNSPTLVRDKSSNSYLLCVGTGYSAASAQANLLVLNPANGSISRTIALGSPSGGNKTTKGVVLDRDADGYDDVLYLGDLAGNIWRADLTVSPWTVSKLFSCGQPIQEAPVITMDQLGRPMLFFGTGEYLTTSDPASTAQQTIYGIVDDGSGATLTPSNLVNQTSTITGLPSNGRGWYVNLVKKPGERVIRTPALVAGELYVPSFLPTDSICTAGAQSWLYTMDYTDGSAANHPGGVHGTSGRSTSEGDGVLADPTVDMINEQVILQSSNSVLLTQDITNALKRLQVKAWRQKWN
ncbi:MAG TPA: PilC/PilY family type IV pilus protein, partial [Polyangiaceae bacterium]|nr:PilC/PilY family type IV pilus protein [Polyangiaceae bacterium]